MWAEGTDPVGWGLVAMGFIRRFCKRLDCRSHWILGKGLLPGSLPGCVRGGLEGVLGSREIRRVSAGLNSKQWRVVGGSTGVRIQTGLGDKLDMEGEKEN